MLQPDQVAQVLRLLGQRPRPSYSAISQRTGVAKGSVARIASGAWQADQRRREQRAERRRQAASTPPASSPIRFPSHTHKVKCGQCGAVVFAPCLACQIRALPKRGGGCALEAIRDAAIGAGELGLQLSEDARAEYERLRGEECCCAGG